MTNCRRIVVCLLIGGVTLALTGVAVTRAENRPPSLTDVRAAYRPSDAQLLDRRGEVIHELRLDERGRRLRWTPLAEISPALRSAVIESEDQRFHHHRGVDAGALAAAAVQWLLRGPPRGGSTISMQLATLIDPQLRPGVRRALERKWRQMRAALALERGWTKAEILEAYLNLVTFRGELQGVAAAANLMFGKAPHGLTRAESQVLAALIRSPNAAADAVARRARALARDDGDVKHAIDEAVAHALAPAVSDGLRRTLAPHVARRLLRRGQGASVQSTIDARLQRVAAQAVHRHLMSLRDRRVRDAAVIVADNLSGDVLAYVGGSGELSRARHVDAARARRQAGSALKPFLYGLAFDLRLLTAASLLEDTPLEVPVGGGIYRPQNYDEQFRGVVSARTALAASLNIPAVRTLALIGPDRFAQQLRALGFAGVVEPGDFYGPSLALGSADVSLWELVGAYRALANGGAWTPLRFEAAAGDQIAPPRVYSAAAAFVVASILADRESRSATFGLESALATRFWSAVKTGTSKSMRDNWCVGFSQRYTVGVWVGNVSGEPMRDVSGVSGAAPIWLDVLAWLHREEPSRSPRVPTGVIARRVAFASGEEPARPEWFMEGSEPPAGPGAEDTPPGLALAPEATARLGDARPRILAPPPEAIIAIDPDIPATNQRIAFAAARGTQAARWVLDGIDVGAAGGVTLWPPEPGAHTLVLADDATRALDVVRFVVRGTTPVSAVSR